MEDARMTMICYVAFLPHALLDILTGLADSSRNVQHYCHILPDKVTMSKSMCHEILTHSLQN